MNPRLSATQPYPFERLARLLESSRAADQPPIRLTVGEPQHAPADVAIEALSDNMRAELGRYPATKPESLFSESVADWLQRRFAVAINHEQQLLSVNGTREALFAIAQVVVDASKRNATVVTPNPFYQIYEGAALLAGAKPYFWNVDSTNGLPNIDSVAESVWRDCQLLYLCSPGNPTGAIADLGYYQRLIELAHRFDFAIASDECYSEIYRDQPPPSLLNACLALGDQKFERCLVFHSLSKRSNLPGLRSGFVSGDRSLIQAFLRYRTYHGSAMSPLVQAVSAAAWNDDAHVRINRDLYNQKYVLVHDAMKHIWNITVPAGGFYLWHDVGVDDESFVRDLYESQALLLLPGQYLARTDHRGENPGLNHVRISLVANPEDCSDAAERLRRFVASGSRKH